MYSGIVGSESLNNPLILNSASSARVLVEHYPTSTITPYWHTFFLKIKDADIQRFMHLVSKEIKAGCFAIFWNEELVYMVFPNRVFSLPKRNFKESKVYPEMITYARKNGVQEEFLNIEEEFERYSKAITED